jgi:hypothetical protein
MSKYYFGWTGANCLVNGTDKAWAVAYAGGYTTTNDTIKYIPRSIMICEEPNKYGNVRLFIPVWFFKKNMMDHRRIRDIDWGENGVSELVER